MNIKSILPKAVLYVSLLAFFLFAVYIIYINQEVFYTAHDRSEFLFGEPFFNTLMSKPFGLMKYVGAWLTQFFFHPALGSVILVTIWVLIFFVGAKAFRLQGSASALMILPIACLLTSVVDLGYWIYIFTIRGYWFSQSVGFLVMLLFLWIARYTPRKWHFVWYLFAFCIFPILGWFALLFVMCLILSDKITWREIFGIIILLFSVGIWHSQLYSNQSLHDVMLAGFPLFQTPVEYSKALSIPFWVLGAFTVIIPLCARYLSKWFVPVLCAAAAIVFTMSLKFQNRNYIDEMRMVRSAENDSWQEVLSVATGNPAPSHTMVMLKNIALMNEGGLLERSFKIGNNGVNVFNPDSIHISLLNIASPLVYYNYGKMNEAIRLSYENAVATGFSPFYMKMISRCARATGEDKLDERFTTLLQHHPFYSDWQPTPMTGIVKDLQQSFGDEINGVENNCERYIIDDLSISSNTKSKVVSEQALFYAMMRCDSHRFWASLRNYVKLHMDESFPIHAQEAYIMYMDKAPEEKRMMLPVEQTVYDRYKQFWETLENLVKRGAKQEEISEKMRNQWKETYWYYNIFARK